jgi:hypothetical protein
MALPKLNDTPKYELTVPSTGAKIKFRPFLVKEEKVLLLAMESQEQTQIFSAITDTIDACIQGDFDVKTLTSFDVEYLFIKIRGKSVGETSTIGLKCGNEECNFQNEVSIPLDEIKVQGLGAVNNTIVLDDSISVEMAYPTFDTVFSDKDVTEAEGSTQLFALLRKCMVAILTEEERVDVSEYPAADVDAFIESTNQQQFQKMVAFVEAMPKVSHKVKFTCTECSKENEFTLEGMQDFF